MADNVTITAGSGTTIAADEITIDGATAKVQRVKPVFGAPGSGADADIGSGTGGSATQRVILDSSQQNANGQTTMANSSPVTFASDQTWGVGSVGFTKLEDAASADGDKGVPMLVVRADTPSNSSGANGDYEFPTIKDGLLWTRLGAATTGGLTMSSYLIASGTNATNVKASAGQIYKVEIFNNSANIGYLKIYNSASAPTAGSGTPVTRLMVPGNATGAGAISTTDLGLTMSTGIGFTFTGGIADADTTSVAASAYIVNIYYK